MEKLVQEILQHVRSLQVRPFILAIDGRCGAGKTTLCRALCQALFCDSIHTDHFFLPPAMRTVERLSKAGGNVHYERFQEEVITKLSSPLPFTYRIFDCKTATLNERKEIKSKDVRIVEGSYSQHPFFGPYADLNIFLDISPAEQTLRIARRDPEKLDDFVQKWIPLEERYFQEFSIKEKADLVFS